MYDQRAKKGSEHFRPRGPWVPHALSGIIGQAEFVPWWYVVVDEIHGDLCRFSVDAWPQVDADGRLVFETENTTLHWMSRRAAHDVIRQAREAMAASAEELAAADRSLRIGDVFAVSPATGVLLGLFQPGLDAILAYHEPAVGLVDITAAARVAARAAADAVGAGELTADDLELLGIPHWAVERGSEEVNAP